MPSVRPFPPFHPSRGLPILSLPLKMLRPVTLLLGCLLFLAACSPSAEAVEHVLRVEEFDDLDCSGEVENTEFLMVDVEASRECGVRPTKRFLGSFHFSFSFFFLLC